MGSAFRITNVVTGGVGGGGGAGDGESIRTTVTQSNTFAAGDIIRYNGSTYVKSRANNATNAEVIGVVETASSSTFTYVGYGKITLAGLTPGEVYFLSPDTAGAKTNIEPTTVGQVIKPVLFGLTSGVGYVQNYRGMVKPSPAQAITNLTYIYAVSTGDGSTVTFDLTNTAPNAEGVIIFVDGLVQRPYLDYTVSNNDLTFVSAPGASTEVEMRIIL